MAPRHEATSQRTGTKAGTGRASTKTKGAPPEHAPTKTTKLRKEDELRSDWEGMTPKPEQPSDDVAAPGQLPEGHE